MKPGTPELTLGVTGRAESHTEAVQLAVHAQGMQALQSARENERKKLREHRLLAEEPFRHLHLAHKGVSG